MTRKTTTQPSSVNLKTVETEHTEIQVAHDVDGRCLGPAGHFILKGTPPLPGSELDSFGVSLPTPEATRNLSAPPNSLREEERVIMRDLDKDGEERRIPSVKKASPTLVDGKSMVVSINEKIGNGQVEEFRIEAYCGAEEGDTPIPFFILEYKEGGPVGKYTLFHEIAGISDRQEGDLLSFDNFTPRLVMGSFSIPNSEDRAYLLHTGTQLKLVEVELDGSHVEDSQLIAAEDSRDAMHGHVEQLRHGNRP